MKKAAAVAKYAEFVIRMKGGVIVKTEDRRNEKDLAGKGSV